MADHRLVLIRHAKSAEGPRDIERPLAPRGERDARAIAAVLLNAKVVPDRVIVSPAQRARQTWQGVQAGLPEAIDLVIDDRIYDDGVDALLEVIREVPSSVRTVALVGHNPSFEDLAHELDDGAGDDAARREMQRKFPTSAVAVFEPSGAWSEVAPRSATLRLFAVARATPS